MYTVRSLRERLCGPLVESLVYNRYSRTYKRIYLYSMLIPLYLRGDVRQLVVVMCIVLLAMATGVIPSQHRHTRHFLSATLCRGGLRFGLAK